MTAELVRCACGNVYAAVETVKVFAGYAEQRHLTCPICRWRVKMARRREAAALKPVDIEK